MVYAIANGLVQGSVYALAATGLVLIFSVVGVPHFAHGEAVMTGGLVTADLVLGHRVPVLLAMACGVAVATVFGIVLSQVLYWPMRDHAETNVLGASLAVVLICEVAASQIWGLSPKVTPTDINGYVHASGARIPWLWLVLIVATVAIVAATYLYVHRSRAGRAMRAMALNRDAARVVGIPVRRYGLLAFGIGSALAGLGGALYSTAFGVQSQIGSGLTIDAFIVIIFAGMGSVFGALWAGLLLGIVQSLSGTYVSTGYAEMFGFIFLLVVLILRPEGMFGFARDTQ